MEIRKTLIPVTSKGVTVTGEKEREYIFFTVKYNHFRDVSGSSENAVLDREDMRECQCVLLLPESYTDDGEETPLILFCHGAWGKVVPEENRVGGVRQAARCVDAGYAALDVTGSDEYGTSMGSPEHIFALYKAYRYAIKHYNLSQRVLIGGSDLKKHWEIMQANESKHLLRRNGELAAEAAAAGNYITVSDALELDTFDVVTTHQASSLCGEEKSFYPYINDILAVVRERQPQAQLWLMEPWAYEVDFDHRDFDLYERDQSRMYAQIAAVSREVAAQLGLGLIPVGTVLQRIRETVPEFDYRNGGLSLCRDGRHLSKDYGRLAAAATWFRALTGQDVRLTEFEDFDMTLVEKILAVVNSI